MARARRKNEHHRKNGNLRSDRCRHGTAVSTLPGPDESLVEDIGRRTEIAQVDMPKTRSMGRGNCANEGGRPMRTLSTCIMVGILAIATGCDTSNTPTPPAPVDGGNGGGDAAVVDGSRAGGDATAADGASGGNDATIPDTGANEAAAADGGIEAASLDGGSGGSDAPTGEGGGDAQSGDAGSCTLPACLATLAANCLPSGDCIQDDSLVLINGSTYSCYDGGITRGDIEPTIDGGVNLIAVEKAGATCYSMTYHAVDIFDNSSSSPIAVMNGSDAGVATLTKRASGDGGTALWSVTCAGSSKAVDPDPSCENVWPLSFPIQSTPWDCSAGTCAW